MALGISGYIPKSTPKIELVQSIRAILEGRSVSRSDSMETWQPGAPAGKFRICCVNYLVSRHSSFVFST